MRNYLDVESTGLNYWTNSVISLAWIITDDANDVVDKIYLECAPDKGSKVWTKEAEEVHKISESQARLFKPALIACHDLLKFFEKNKIVNGVIRYHANANFDTRMLFAMFMKEMQHNYYDIYKFISPNEHQNTIKLIKERIKLPSYSLDEIAKFLGINFNHHNALSDTECLVNICKELKI